MGKLFKHKYRMRLGVMTSAEDGYEFTDIGFDTNAIGIKSGLAVMMQNVRHMITEEVFDIYESRGWGNGRAVQDIDVQIGEWNLEDGGYNLVVTLWDKLGDRGYTSIAEPLMYRVEIENILEGKSV